MPRRGVAGSRGNLVFICLRSCQTASEGAAPSAVSTGGARGGLRVVHSLASSAITHRLRGHPGGCEWYLAAALFCIFLLATVQGRRGGYITVINVSRCEAVDSRVEFLVVRFVKGASQTLAIRLVHSFCARGSSQERPTQDSHLGFCKTQKTNYSFWDGGCIRFLV